MLRQFLERVYVFKNKISKWSGLAVPNLTPSPPPLPRARTRDVVSVFGACARSIDETLSSSNVYINCYATRT